MVQFDTQVVPLVKSLVILVGGYIFARFFASILGSTVSKKINPHIGRVSKNITFYTLVAVALVTAIGQFIDLTALLAAAGIAGIAIGLASQRSVSNIISGIFLLLDQPFMVGDAVSIEGEGGIVIDMTLLSTRLRTFDNRYLRIPNEMVAGGKIINFTKFEIRRIDLDVGIAYKEDVGEAIDVLSSVVKNHKLVLIEPEPLIIATRYGDSSINIVIRAWVPRTEFFTATSDLIKETKKALDDAGIEIPFPHRTIYFGKGEIGRFKE